MSNNLGTILTSLVAFQLFFVAAYLFTNRKGNTRNNRLLGLVFLMFSISLADFILRLNGVILPIALFHIFDDGFFLLYGPVLYFYVQGTVYRDFEFKKRNIIHFIPYVVYTALLVYQLIILDLDVQSALARSVDKAELPIWIYLVSLIMYVHILCYLWFARRTVVTYQQVIKNRFSSIDKINLDWLSFTIQTFAVITVVAMVHNVMPVFGNIFIRYATLVILLLLTFLFINRVLFKALNQPLIFSGINTDDPEKYAGSTLQPTELDQYKNQLNQLMEEEKLYMNSELSSQDLADRLQLSSKVLSQIINQGFNKNFFDYVNTYRCEEVKKLLRGPDRKITVLEAMYQSGFNSKSSFNKEFKKLTGQTPSEYKRG